MSEKKQNIYYGVTPLKHTDKNIILSTRSFRCPFCGSEMNYLDFNASPNAVKPYQEVIMPWEFQAGRPIRRAWKEEFECSLKCSNCEIVISNLKFENMYWEDAPEKQESEEEQNSNDETDRAE